MTMAATQRRVERALREALGTQFELSAGPAVDEDPEYCQSVARSGYEPSVENTKIVDDERSVRA